MSEQPLEVIEVVVNGRVAHRSVPAERRTSVGAYESDLRVDIPVEEGVWLAVRCFEKRPGGRIRFAHTAPWFVEVKDRPLRPRQDEVQWLIQCVQEEINRSRSLLPKEALREYEQALEVYQRIARDER